MMGDVKRGSSCQARGSTGGLRQNKDALPGIVLGPAELLAPCRMQRREGF